MSWSIYVIGTREAVLKYVDESYMYPKEGDQSIINSAKDFIHFQIDLMPETVKLIQVEANGHTDSSTSNGSVKVTSLQNVLGI